MEQKMITAKINPAYESSTSEIAKLLLDMPETIIPLAHQALECEKNQEYEKAIDVCNEILDIDGSQGEIRMLLGRSYFALGNMTMAKKVFEDISADYPKEELPKLYLGVTLHAMGQYAEAVKQFDEIYPLTQYHPFYYTAYGDALQQKGDLKKSREIFRKEIEEYEKTGFIPGDEMLDGAFQNLLCLDAGVNDQYYEKDMKLYQQFLDEIEMTDTMQAHLSGTIVELSMQMKNKWYQPKFLEFIQYIDQKNYLTNTSHQDTLDSAFASYESYRYHMDPKVSAFIEEYLGAIYQLHFGVMPEDPKEIRDEAKVTALTYDWYLCQYFGEHQEEIAWLEKEYPHTYQYLSSIVNEIRNDKEKTAESLLEQLLPYAGNTPKEELRRSLGLAYAKAVSQARKVMYRTHGEETFKRIETKVGRNDPCPCGSGKKYKKCCGR